MSRAIATYSQKRQMESLIFENTLALDRPDHRAWFADWGFDRVAKAVSKEFNAEHAKRVARDLELTVVPAPPPPSVEARVAAIEQQMQMMAAMLQDIITDLINMEKRDANNAKEWHANPDYAGASDRRGHGEQMGLGRPGESPPGTLQQASLEGIPEAVGRGLEPISFGGDSKDVEAGGRARVYEDAAEAPQGHA